MISAKQAHSLENLDFHVTFCELVCWSIAKIGSFTKDQTMLYLLRIKIQPVPYI